MIGAKDLDDRDTNGGWRMEAKQAKYVLVQTGMLTLFQRRWGTRQGKLECNDQRELSQGYQPHLPSHNLEAARLSCERIFNMRDISGKPAYEATNSCRCQFLSMGMIYFVQISAVNVPRVILRHPVLDFIRTP